jgi:hypothetical protein
MIRIYLDWNVFSYLKRFKDTQEPYISLDRILTQNKNSIIIPYTSAHLSDLITSYKKSEEGKIKTLADLDYLAQLTDSRCILYDYKDQKTYPDKYDIHDYFQQLLEGDQMLSGNIENLFNGTGMETMFSSVLDIFKLLPSGIDVTNIDQTPSGSKILNEAFQGFTKPSSFYDTLNETFSLTNKYNTDPAFYRGIRNASLDELRLFRDYSNTENPIAEMNKILESSSFKTSFVEFAEVSLKNYFGDKIPSRFDIFTNYYRVLDYFGYYRDKVFKNMIQDSFHAYYGAHCDFFVTDDDNTYHKAKVIYEHFNIETVVCKTNKFLSEFYGKSILNNETEKRLTEIIPGIISTSFVLSSTIDEEMNPVDIYKIDHYILSYFNRLQLTRNNDKTVSLYLYKNPKNYSSFYFFKEIETVTNKIIAQFGVDLNARTEYVKDIETQELLDNIWKGRVWQFERTKIELNIKEAPFSLTLSIHLPR